MTLTQRISISSAVTAFAMLLAIATAGSANAQSLTVDPAATATLKRMTDYLGSLKQFGVTTQNTIEDLLDSGHRIDTDVAATVLVSRPAELRAERTDGLQDQVFFYDGKSLTLYDPSQNFYATEPAPPTIEETLDLARETLGIVLPVTDLVYRNAFALLMQDVTLAAVVGQSRIGDELCDHLLFSRPGVDFQVWVSTGAKPLPCKYVVTDTSTPALVSVSSVLSDWNTAPAATAADFSFVAPAGATKISFMPIEGKSGASR